MLRYEHPLRKQLKYVEGIYCFTNRVPVCPGTLFSSSAEKRLTNAPRWGIIRSTDEAAGLSGLPKQRVPGGLYVGSSS